MKLFRTALAVPFLLPALVLSGLAFVFLGGSEMFTAAAIKVGGFDAGRTDGES